MKKIIALLMVLCTCFGLMACGAEEKDPYAASQADIDLLEGKYADRVACYGDLHDHSKDADFIYNDTATKAYAPEWIEAMDALGMDFQALLNHRQMYHMFADGWDDTRLIGGTEAGTDLSDSKAIKKHVDINIIVPNAKALENIFTSFAKFDYSGGKNGVPVNQGLYQNGMMRISDLQNLIQIIKDQGGLYVHPHPKQEMQSDDPLDYWFADYTGLEVFYVTRESQQSKDNYKLWTDLLALGKRVWATAGYDQHNLPTAKTLNVVYSEKKDAETYVSHLAQGDFVCGSVGIRMAIGDATMGGHTDFNGQRVVISTGDFHTLSAVKDHKYRVDVISDKGVVYSKEITLDTAYIAFDADESASFYRVEVHDTSRRETLLAIGNPIWND